MAMAADTTVVALVVLLTVFSCFLVVMCAVAALESSSNSEMKELSPLCTAGKPELRPHICIWSPYIRQ